MQHAVQYCLPVSGYSYRRTWLISESVIFFETCQVTSSWHVSLCRRQHGQADKINQTEALEAVEAVVYEE